MFDDDFWLICVCTRWPTDLSANLSLIFFVVDFSTIRDKCKLWFSVWTCQICTVCSFFLLSFFMIVPRNHQASAGILFRKVNYLRVLLTGVVQSLLVS